MIYYILLAVSVGLGTVQRAVMNFSSKNYLKNQADVYKFNALNSLAGALFFIALSIGGSISWYTVLLGLLFGVITNFSGVYMLKALRIGPMHYTTLIVTSSMIIPTLSDPLMFGKEWSVVKVIGAVVLLLFIGLTLRTSSAGKFSFRWLGCCMVAFCSSGTIGILQKIHQASPYATERQPLLAVAFLVSACCSFVFCTLTKKNAGIQTTFPVISKQLVFALLCAFGSATTNLLNLTLSGILPSALFFPVVNGGAVVLATLVSLFVFKETLNRRQAIGLTGSIAALFVICLF